MLLKAAVKAPSPCAAGGGLCARILELRSRRLKVAEIFPDLGLCLAVGDLAMRRALGKQLHIFIWDPVDLVHRLGSFRGIERLHALHHLTSELGGGRDDLLHQMPALLDGGGKVVG